MWHHLVAVIKSIQAEIISFKKKKHLLTESSLNSGAQFPQFDLMMQSEKLRPESWKAQMDHQYGLGWIMYTSKAIKHISYLLCDLLDLPG